MVENEYSEELESEEPELTTQQRDALRRSMENLRRSLSPKINFNFPTIKLPESTLKSISVASSLAAQHSKLFDSLKPVLAAHDAWKKQFGLINSDIFKMFPSPWRPLMRSNSGWRTATTFPRPSAATPRPIR